MRGQIKLGLQRIELGFGRIKHLFLDFGLGSGSDKIGSGQHCSSRCRPLLPTIGSNYFECISHKISFRNLLYSKWARLIIALILKYRLKEWTDPFKVLWSVRAIPCLFDLARWTVQASHLWKSVAVLWIKPIYLYSHFANSNYLEFGPILVLLLLRSRYSTQQLRELWRRGRDSHAAYS